MSERILATRTKPEKGAFVFYPAELPMPKGIGEIDWLCGGCQAVIFPSVPEDELRRMFTTTQQALIVCPDCQTMNALPRSG